MGKKLTALLFVTILCLSMCACTADEINTTVSEVGEEVGVDINLNLKQEDLDNAKDLYNEAKDKVTDVVTDEGVREAAGDFFDAIKEASGDEEE